MPTDSILTLPLMVNKSTCHVQISRRHPLEFAEFKIDNGVLEMNGVPEVFRKSTVPCK